MLAIATGCADPGTPLAPDDDDPAATDSEQEPPETSATTGGAIDSSDDAAESTTAEPVDCDFDDVGIVVPTPDGCCGCTCGETRWSCSADTCLTPDGTAEALAPEAGFFELAPYEYSWNGAAKTSARSRVWYSFWPADDQPQQRPLMILFNGGPGSSTGLLFGSNTAPFTLDPQRTDSVAATERPWTEGFNLLFVDAPGTGFSYDLAQPDGTTQSVGIDPDRDASAFISVLLRFLARHPALQSNQIVILGESYGGTRAMLMLEQMLDYETLIDGTNPYQNPSVYAEIRRHLASLEPDGCGDGWSRDEIASQLRFVSVQGLVAGYGQVFGPASTSSSCIPGGDVYHCDRPDGWLWGIAAQIADRLRQPAVLDTVLGVDP
nr:S10 family peptidase [Deltaproteobacteria bacterium]